jgi:hypothetical protein
VTRAALTFALRTNLLPADAMTPENAAAALLGLQRLGAEAIAGGRCPLVQISSLQAAAEQAAKTDEEGRPMAKPVYLRSPDDPRRTVAVSQITAEEVPHFICDMPGHLHHPGRRPRLSRDPRGGRAVRQ